MLSEILLGFTALLWGGLWGYSTLLLVLVFMRETESLYAYPMRSALDRFVDTLGFPWLKSLHQLQLERLRWISYVMFGLVSVGISVMLVFLD